MYEDFSFFSFNKESDWRKGIYQNLTINQEGMSITQTEKYGMDDTIYMGDQVGVSYIYDFTLGKNNRIYLLDETSSVWTYDFRNRHLELLLNKQHQVFTNKASLVSFGDLLFIAEPNGIVLAYSLSNNQIMWTLSTWMDHLLYPLAISIQKTTGFLYVLTPLEVEVDENGQKFIPENSPFVILKMNVSGEVIAVFQSTFTLPNKRKLLHVKYQFLMDVSNEGFVYVFDKGSNVMYQFSNDGHEHTLFSLLPNKQYFGLCVDSNHHFYFGDSRNDEVVGEDTRYIVKVNQEGSFNSVITSYRGRVDKMVMDQQDSIVIWDGQQERFSILMLKPRTMERESTNLLEGVFLSTSIDTKMDQTKWHKVLMDAYLPKETQMMISYFASDDKRIIMNGQQVDIDELIKDDTISLLEREKALQPLWSNEMLNPKDALLFNAEGRFLWIKIKLTGSEKKTPLLKKMRIYFPRMSYLSYLPAFYQEDKTSSEFLERYLSIFAKFITEMDEQIQSVPNYFDPNLVSGDLLRWLSNWLGIAADDSWSDQQLRELIRHAPYLYKKRGTKEAIKKIVEIYTGEVPLIVEHFQLKTYKQDSLLYQVIMKLYGDNPYYFYVLVKPNVVNSEKTRIMLQNILDEEKPAFTEAKLIILEPWIYLDMHSYLEINTYLTERSLMKLDNKSYMPSDTVLIDLDGDSRMDVHTRIELDSKLE